MGMTAESGAVLLPRHFKMTLERELEVVWAPIALATLFFVWLLFLRRPELEIENQFPIPPFTISTEDRILEWPGTEVRIPIIIRNSKKLLLRSIKVRAEIAEYPEYRVGADFALIDPYGNSVKFGQPLSVKLGHRPAVAVIRLAIDLPEHNHISSPKDFPEFDGSVKLRINGTIHYVNFKVAPSLGDFWLGIDPGTSGACVAGGDKAGDGNIVTVPLNLNAREDNEERYVIPSLVYIAEMKAMQGRTPTST